MSTTENIASKTPPSGGRGAKHILVIPGDGIGPEVTTWGKAVLEKIGQDFGHEFTFDEALMGHAGIEATGNPLT